ncbi:MAG: LuxR C-terminal-related transcriptional regulator [Opitutus sp.]
MSYSYRMLAVFSSVIEQIYDGDKTVGQKLASPVNGKQSSLDRLEDVQFLEELLKTHPRVSAPSETQTLATEVPSKKFPADDFGRLKGAGLTARECEILFWISEGKHDAEIALVAHCAPRTVGKHIENILAKLHAETRLAAAHTALAWLKQNR